MHGGTTSTRNSSPTAARRFPWCAGPWWERAARSSSSPRAHGRLEELQPACIRIQAHACAERQRFIHVAVPDRESRRAGQSRRLRQLAQYIGAGVVRARLLAVNELAKGDATHAAEDTRDFQVGPHAIQPVGPLAGV